MPSDRMILLQLANGLNFIHSKQLAHGDIRPENVLVFINSFNSSTVYVKWTGFGFLKSAFKAVQLSQQQKGSIHWMAPELLKLVLVGDSSSSELPVATDLVMADIFPADCTFFYYLSGGVHPIQTGISHAILPNMASRQWNFAFAHGVITEIMLSNNLKERSRWMACLLNRCINQTKDANKEHFTWINSSDASIYLFLSQFLII